jgi:ribosomal protein S12 methylthiotransferase accessory factor
MVHLNYTLPRPPGSGCFAASSNGLASGNHLLEALSHGISEVVERDAATLWALAGPVARERTRIDQQTVHDSGCRTVLARLEEAGIAVGIWDISSDVGIAAFACELRGDPHAPLGHRVARGYGCHPCRSIALLRALTEAVQSRLTIIAGTRDDLERRSYEAHDLAGGAGAPTGPAACPPRHFADTPSFDAESFNEDIRWQLDRLSAVGIRQVIVVDLTRPELGVPVVRVVIPGLELAIMGPSDYALGTRARSLRARRP